MLAISTKLCSEWTAARKQLSSCLDIYLSITKSLGELGTQPSIARESLLGDFLSIVDKERALLLRDADRIVSSLPALHKLRNSSTGIVPVGRLPPEILASIFTTAVEASRESQSSAEKPLDYANIVSSVCTHWRDIALSTSALWTYIDLTRRGGADHAMIWLQRGGSCPRDVRVTSALGDQYNNLLEPYTDCLRSLILNTNTTLAQHTILSTYLRSKQKPLILESLAFKGDIHPGVLFPAGTLIPSKAEMDDFLRPIRELYLRNEHFHWGSTSFYDWTSAAFQDLQWLSLVDIPKDSIPSCAQFLDVLHASPRLQYLELANLYNSPTPNSHPTPVTLNHLETLWLHSITGSLEDWLLGAIIPRPEGLTLGLSEYIDLEDSIGLGLSLAAPDRIKELYFCWKQYQMYQLDIQGLLYKFPRLEVLAFKRLNFEIVGLNLTADETKYGKLQVLDLVSCRLRDPGNFEDLVVHHSIDYLRMSECDWMPASLELFRKFPDYVVSDEPGDFMERGSPFD